MKRPALRIVSLCVLMIVILSAALTSCGKDGYKSESYNEMASNGITADNSYISESALEKAADASSDKASNDLQQRKLIYTVRIDAQTEEFDKTVSEVETNLSSMGGYVESSYRYGNSGYQNTRSVEYTLRIPTEKLDEFLSSVSGTMTISSQNKSVNDVTASYTDIASRLETLRTEQKALQELLASADSVENILLVREQLTSVTADIESYEAQIRTYDSLISYSTVTLSLSEVKRVTVKEEKTVWGRISENFSETLYDVGDFFVELFVFLVSASPILVIVAVVGLGIFFIVKGCIRRSRKKKAARVIPAHVPGPDDTVVVKPEQS